MANARGHLSLNIDDNWRPPLRIVKGAPNEFGLNDAIELTKIRMAQDDFLEPTFAPGQDPSPEELTKTAIRLWSTGNLPGHNLSMAKNEEIEFELKKCCSKCGAQKHTIKDCKDRIPFQECTYDHGGEDLPKHSIVVCPILHHLCDNCHMRGHKESSHQFWDPLQMKSLFQRHQHYGCFTCIPFLAKVPKFASKVLYYHWGMGLCLENLEHCLGNAYRLGILEPSLCFGQLTQDRENARIQEAVCRRELEIEIASFNLKVDENNQCPSGTTREGFEKIRQQWEQQQKYVQTVQARNEQQIIAKKPRKKISFP